MVIFCVRVLHNIFLYGKKCMVIFCMGKILAFFCMAIFCVRVLHNIFLYGKKCMVIFLCVHYIVIFCMGKNASNFFVW